MINEIQANKYCIEGQIHLIENYELAINDNNQTWHCHHRRETDENKTSKQLIDEGLYWNRPAEELIFLTNGEHTKLHKKGNRNCKGKHWNLSEETKKKIAASKKGKPRSDETKQKLCEAKKKFKWSAPDGDIIEMDKANVKKWHPDWILIEE